METNPYEIQVWTQMFFTDGSVSQGIRTPAKILDSQDDQDEMANHFLKDLNRDIGMLMIWGAGIVQVSSYPRKPTAISCLLEE